MRHLNLQRNLPKSLAVIYWTTEKTSFNQSNITTSHTKKTPKRKRGRERERNKSNCFQWNSYVSDFYSTHTDLESTNFWEWSKTAAITAPEYKINSRIKSSEQKEQTIEIFFLFAIAAVRKVFFFSTELRNPGTKRWV